MLAWETSAGGPRLDMRRKFDDDEDEFEDDGFTFDDDEDEDEDLDDEDDLDDDDDELDDEELEEFEELRGGRGDAEERRRVGRCTPGLGLAAVRRPAILRFRKGL